MGSQNNRIISIYFFVFFHLNIEKVCTNEQFETEKENTADFLFHYYLKVGLSSFLSSKVFFLVCWCSDENWWFILGPIQKVEVQDEKEMVTHQNEVNGKNYFRKISMTYDDDDCFFVFEEIVVDREVADPVVIIRIDVLVRVVHLDQKIVELDHDLVVNEKKKRKQGIGSSFILLSKLIFEFSL